MFNIGEITDMSDLDDDTLKEIVEEVLDPRVRDAKTIIKKYNLDAFAMNNFMVGIRAHQLSLSKYLNGTLGQRS